MISIGKPAPGQVRYCLDHVHEPMSALQAVASRVEDYYPDGAGPPGGWVGGGSSGLGLRRRVTSDELLRVLAGAIRPAASVVAARICAGPDVMIAHRRQDVAQLTGRARALLAPDGRLDPETLYLPAGARSPSATTSC